MTSARQNLVIGLAVSTMLCAVFDQNVASARGGGAGFGRGNFGRAGFDRDGFDRGFDHYGSDVGDIHGIDSDYPHPAAAEDHTYNWGDGQHGLATDNGLNRAAVDTPGEAVRMAPAQMAARGDMVRDAYRYPGVFDNGWWRDHPNAWGYGQWGNDWAWGATDWPMMAGFWECLSTLLLFLMTMAITSPIKMILFIMVLNQWNLA